MLSTPTCFGTRVPSSGSLLKRRNTNPTRPSRCWSHSQWGRSVSGLVCWICVPLYAFFRVIPWPLNFICWRLGTLHLFHLHRQVGTPTCLWRWNRQSVLKCWHIKFRHWGFTQKKAYNIQNTVQVCAPLINKTTNMMQLGAISLLFLEKHYTCFGCSLYPSSGVS
jgi:hypothetical protein